MMKPTVAQPLTIDHAALRAVLQTAAPVARGTRYVAALRAARTVLLDAPVVPAEVVVITDLQRSGVTGLAGLELPAARDGARGVGGRRQIAPTCPSTGVDVRRVADADRTRTGRAGARGTREASASRAR